jgi:predicted DNA-binding transcriptional regulator AlpA
VTNGIDALPPELSRNRILGAADAAAFWGVSVPHWRRLYRAKQVPRPIRLSERRLGWRVGDLVDALAARAA